MELLIIIIPILLQCLFDLFCGLLVSYAGYKCYIYYKRNITQYKSMWYFALTTFICVSLSFFITLIFTSILPIFSNINNFNLCPIFYNIQVILSSIFKINLYLFFLQRIHDTFEFSIHQINPILLNLLRFLTISYWTIQSILQV